MKKTLFTLALGLGLLENTSLLIAQATDAPPASQKQTQEETGPSEKEDEESDQPETQAEQKSDDKKSDDKKSDDKKSDDKKSDDKKSDDKKSDDKKSDDKKSDDKKSDDKKSDDKKSDDKKSDDKKSDESQSDDESSDLASRARRFLTGNNGASELAYSKRSDEFVDVFKPVIASAATSTVKIMSGRRQLALGVIVEGDGFVLTKASELKSNLTVKLADGRESSATVYGVHPETDLALLKINTDNISPIQWSQNPAPVVGQWLATPNGQKSILDVGIVGVNARVIPPSSPFIGIGPPMRDTSEVVGAKVNMVVARSPADDADVMVGDIITHIDGIEIKDWDGLRKTLGQYDAGDRIELTLTRVGKEMKINLTLAEKDKASPQNTRSNQQNSMGSVLSRRRKDFPNAFQHDSMLTSTTCGGPVVDLDGRVVGINIARAGRVDSLALPVETVLPVIALLKTGELAPAIVNKARIAEVDKELADVNKKITGLPDKKSLLQTQYEVERAKQEELQKILRDVQDRLKVIELKSKNFGEELDEVKSELKSLEKLQQRLEADRKQLATGLR